MDCFLSSIEYLLEVLYYIKDMESWSNEKLKKNWKLLKSKIFTLQMWELAKFGLEEYNEKLLPKYFLHTVLRYTNILLEVIEKFCEGKTLLMKTQKIKLSSKNIRDETEEDALQVADYDDFGYVEKRFNFKTTLMEFASYSIIENIITLLHLPDLLDDELIQAISIFLNRIIFQLKGTWIFYQLDTMNTFDLFLNDYRKEVRYIQLIQSIKMILESFFERCKENPLLPFEIMFQFSDINSKENILTNYEHNYIEYNDDDGDFNDDVDEAVIENMDNYTKELEKSGWQIEEESKLVEYFEIFKDSEDWALRIARILNKPIEAVQEKLKDMKLLNTKEEVKRPNKLDEEMPSPDNKNDAGGYQDCKEATQNFIKNLISIDTPTYIILNYLDHFDKVIKKYLEFEKNKDKNNAEM